MPWLPCFGKMKTKRVRLAELIEQVNHPILLETQKQLREYFAGTRQQFDLPLDFEGTVFQKKVWQALLSIPFGETRSYRDIAEQVGNIKAVRAVGAANGKIQFQLLRRAIVWWGKWEIGRFCRWFE